MEDWKIAIIFVLGVGLIVNVSALVWAIRHIIRSKKEGIW